MARTLPKRPRPRARLVYSGKSATVRYATRRGALAGASIGYPDGHTEPNTQWVELMRSQLQRAGFYVVKSKEGVR